MWPFKDKKKERLVPVYNDYGNWKEDLGFLNLVMSRKKNITKNYYISIFSKQLSDTDYIRDEDLGDIITESVEEVIKELSKNYKLYLIDKYFGSETELIKFITEDFYVELTSSAITQNSEKIRASMIKKKISSMAGETMPDDQKEAVPEEVKEEKTIKNKRKAR
jgi:hypothetical protein